MIVFKLAAAVLITLSTEATAQTSFWTSASFPGTREATNDSKFVTLGLKFYSDVAGSITAVRFYKGTRNTGIHIGTLWSSGGSRLATVTFTGETSSGWQQATFSSPVNITARTTYVISYSAPYGNYAYDQYYPWSTVSAGPLHFSGASPGVFAYASGTVFPTGSWNSTNYWVDVVFRPTSTTTPTPTTYSISGTVSGSGGAGLTLSGTVARSTATDSLGKYTFGSLPQGSYIIAPSKIGYTFTPPTASVSINTASVTGVNFTGTAAATSLPHTVTLSWNASTSANIKGYNVYRATVAGGSYAKLNPSLLTGRVYIDSGVSSGRIYYYVTTSVNSSNVESGYSNQAAAVVPSP
jgi:hypothetical protein